MEIGKRYMRMFSTFIWFRIWTSTGCCEPVEGSVLVSNGGEFIDK